MDYMLDGKLDRNGIETDKRARAYSEQHGVSYGQALRTIIKESNQTTKQKIDRATARYQREHGNLPNDWRVYEDSTGSVIEVELRVSAKI